MTSVKCLPFIIMELLFIPRSVLAIDNPIYQNNVLTIPHIDTPEQVGKYLDITLTPTKEGTWKLNTYREAGSNRSYFAPVTKAELITIDVQPKQVFLRLSGEFGSGCGEVGQVIYRLENNVFNIAVNDGFDYPIDIFCADWIRPFQKDIALPVFGLKAGTYTYNVNGKLTGSFTLDVDNNLP